MRFIESTIQRECVRWFRLQYPELDKLLFAVPNGGGRSKAGGGILKAEGVVPGVSDLILLVARGGYNALCIEMKTDKGRMSDSQKDWQKQAEKHGSKCVICRSVDDFINEINNYLLNDTRITFQRDR